MQEGGRIEIFHHCHGCKLFVPLILSLHLVVNVIPREAETLVVITIYRISMIYSTALTGMLTYNGTICLLNLCSVLRGSLR
jgi:hypothetical protein